jgi:hypothetical protein
VATVAAFWIVAGLAATTRVSGLALWLSIRMLMLPLAAVVAWQMWWLSKSVDSLSTRWRQFVLVTTVAAWCSLVQFPFTYPTYFAYVAPLVLLATIALAGVSGRPAPIFRAIALAGYCAVGAAMRPRIFPARDIEPGPRALLPPPKGGILISIDEATRYGELVRLLKMHARGPYMLATPDVPEVYFLSGLKNPTRTFFEGFDFPPTAPVDVLKKIDEFGITAVVINHHPQFSDTLSAALADSLVRRFPQTQSLGRLEVRWHE